MLRAESMAMRTAGKLSLSVYLILHGIPARIKVACPFMALYAMRRGWTAL